MNTPEFNELFEQTVEMCRETLCHKADEYAEDDDRLHNFNIAAILQGNTPIEALGGMMVKHTVSVYDLIRRTGKSAEISDAMWDEKIMDSINYLILLRAAVADKHKSKASCEICRTEIQRSCSTCKFQEIFSWDDGVARRITGCSKLDGLNVIGLNVMIREHCEYWEAKS